MPNFRSPGWFSKDTKIIYTHSPKSLAVSSTRCVGHDVDRHLKLENRCPNIQIGSYFESHPVLLWI